MIAKQGTSRSRGLIIPILAVAMVALLGFIALAIDIGMIAITRTQAQNAADAAAMAGARALNGNSSGGYNVTGATDAATNAIKQSSIQSQPIPASQVDIKVGSYTYDYSQNKFLTNIPTAQTDTPNLVTSTITASGQNVFGRMLGSSAFNVSSTATAVHRPRDVAVILDMSGSMRFDSLLGTPYMGPRPQSNNSESVYPQFGHYTSTSSGSSTWPAPVLQNTTPDTISGNSYGLANVTDPNDSGDAVVGDFYQNALGGTPVAAFTPAADSYATTPDGDRPLVKYHTSNSYGNTVQQIIGSNSGTVFQGYTATPFTGGGATYTGPAVPEYSGYTRGPRNWGKTFFIWPPDPRSGKDWRSLYFYNGGTTTALTDNTRLWDFSGGWKAPGSSTYAINYSAILAWIKSSPNPFPPRLRAGRILYYDAIPSTIDTSSYPPTDLNQRFWKQYIDYVLGVFQTSANNYDVITPLTGYGDDFTWGPVQISTKPAGSGVAYYMNYGDNPMRPQLHFWFGPMTMIDFLGNYNMWVQYPGSWAHYWPGNCHEGPVWACKLGIQAALGDIQKNHPNDFVSLAFFSTPKTSANGTGAFNRIRVPLGRDYQRMSDTLWFPPSTIDSPGTELRMYDNNMSDVPHAYGGTTTVMGFMLAYNQFSSNTSLRTYAPSPAPPGEAGGFGRRGSQRLIILETDGMANAAANVSFTNAGVANSYYNVRQPGEYPTISGSGVVSQIYSVVNQICALETASPPGYSTTRKPVLIHCMALGPIFDPTNNNPQLGPALDLLQNIQYIGKTQASVSTPLESYKIITGKASTRTDNIRKAFGAIMQDGVQVSLIQ